MHLFDTLPKQIWAVCTFSVAGFALWRGGWAERTVAIGMVVDSYAAGIMQNRRNWASPQWADLAIDAIYLIVMVWVAIKSDRIWTLFAAGFQLVDVSIYLAHSANLRIGPRAPFAATEIWGYLILIILMIGTWQHWRDQRQTRG